MCYLARQHQTQTELGGTTTPPSPGPLRPRLVAAVSAALIGSLALATLSGPPATPPPVSEKNSAVPLVSKTSTVPSGGLVEVGSGVDDGVPASSENLKASLGHCHHGM